MALPKHWMGPVALAAGSLALGSLLGFAPRPWARADGPLLEVDRPEQSFGVGRAGDEVSTRFSLTNHSLDPIRVLGCRVTCTCTVAESLPLEIPPGQRRPLVIRVGLSGPHGKVRLPVVLYTNVPGQADIPLAVVGEVADALPSTSSR